MKKFVYVLPLVAVLAIATAVFVRGSRAQVPASSPLEDVPLVRLIAVPEKYAGKRVRVIGFVRLEFEGDVLYPHREDYDHALLGNGIWISTSLPEAERKTRDLKYCLLEGTFDAKNKGHMGMWSGALNHITRFDVWSDPAKPRR